jgi:anthranilate synthase component 2
MRLLLIDYYDSFTYNIADYLRRCGAEVDVCEANSVDSPAFAAYDGLVFSPGPGNPVHMPDLRRLMSDAIGFRPVLGICLGFQAMGLHFGGHLRRGHPCHGKQSVVCRIPGTPSWLLQDIPDCFTVVRYHSLVIGGPLSGAHVTLSAGEGEPMALEHPDLPVAGVQYHPEAWLSAYGLPLFHNWLRKARENRG